MVEVQLMEPVLKAESSYPASLFIAGDYDQAVKSAREYCDEISWCFTVTKTMYVYKGGQEEGVIIGLINYPRFPNSPSTIDSHAMALGLKLIKDLNQQSFSIQNSYHTCYVSFRQADLEERAARFEKEEQDRNNNWLTKLKGLFKWN